MDLFAGVIVFLMCISIIMSNREPRSQLNRARLHTRYMAYKR